MSYRLLQLLTLPIIALIAAQLPAQSTEFRQAVRKLSAPTAIERAEAVAAIAGLKDDISADLRLAFKSASDTERTGLFEAVESRQDAALLHQAMQSMAECAEPANALYEAARSYALSLPADKQYLDEVNLSATEKAVWQEISSLWLQREIVASLLDALQKPGKFQGQFQVLRTRDSAAVDKQLLALIDLEPAVLEALNLGSLRRFDEGIEADRLFSNPWRKLTLARGNFDDALQMIRTNQDPDRNAAVSRDILLASVEVLSDLRCAAVRALASSEQSQALVPFLRALHTSAGSLEPAPALRAAVSTEGLRTEIELTLARFGDRELVDARVAELRAQVERYSAVPGNVTYKIANRPDLAARNEAAHLLLRSGDPASAEKEWLSLVKDGRELERLAKDSQRSAVASFIGSIYYNLACAQALQLKLTRAAESLETAVASGYRDFAWMLEDGDLGALRRTPEFRAWFSDLAPPALVDRLPAVD
ncbi:MAG: hypothetical protein IPP14_13755 [Planctomycetes bacterium]|nr:hypothetical protein [Planctomycetota bacterium]